MEEQFVKRFNVEKLNRNGSAFYLTTFAGEFVWSTDADAAHEFDDADEAQEVADQMDGEVMEFQCFRKVFVRPSAPALFLAAAE
ncbi:hypothetical protein HRR99_03100 [Agrobacterium vaccinii]|uniref:hypothetical protein n=1 Tax=Agrobacterium vaccinii TaxID=2735528 RepID=UPI001E3D7D3D|nr:hypothetical protein [Agrobacterium vaccinii]UHS60578.1 hypothetical protein HRR99_03100 [Agrobacterium vaccinii]